MAPLIACAALALVCAAQEPAVHVMEGGYVAPVSGKLALPLDGKETRLRGKHTVLLYVSDRESLNAQIANVGVGRYEDSLTYELRGPGDKILREGAIARGKQAQVSVAEPTSGIYRLVLNTGRNACTLRSSVRHTCVEASTTAPLAIVYYARRLHFFVPMHAKLFTAHVAGSGRAEHVVADVFAPDGKLLASDTTVGKPGTRCDISVSVPQGQDGRAWSIGLRKAEGHVFEDCRVSLSGDVAPFVADHPARLVMPLVSLFAREVNGQTEVGVRVYVGRDASLGMKLHLRVTQQGSPKPVYDKVHDPLSAGEVAVRVPGQTLTTYRLRAQVMAKNEQVIMALDRDIAVAHGALFDDVTPREEHGPVQPTSAETARGYQVFTRGEPGDIRPGSRPRPEERIAALRIAATPGEFEPASFALYPLRDLAGARCTVSDFAGPSGARLAAHAADLRVARCWPQRTDWRSKTFHVIPELLERRDTVDLRKAVAQQFYVIVSVPDACRAGLYRATVRVQAGSRVSDALELQLRVLPFKLRTPPGIVWGLYPDTGRWHHFPPDQVEREMVEFKEHGINALMLYPLGFSDWSYANGKVSVDFTRFREQMRLYHRVGFDGVMVVSIQGSESFVARLIGAPTAEPTPAFVDAYRQMLALLRKESVEGQWPEHCLHSVDEPSGGARGEAAIRTLMLIKEAGFKTFNTCYRDFVRERIDPYLDYRCYNNIGFGHMSTPEATAELRAETLAAGDHFWWYGSGCYTNSRFIQDGNVIANRFMTGFHFWRTAATGAWSWTFLRPKGSAYDDFDGTSQREHKDACIAYPTPDGKGLVPTLQWEGIREGVDDYKYLYTLKTLIDEAKSAAKPETVAAGKEAQTELAKMLDEMPWLCRDGQFTNTDANRCRKEVVRLMLKVWQRR